jgi:hypothetical protein
MTRRTYPAGVTGAATFSGRAARAEQAQARHQRIERELVGLPAIENRDHGVYLARLAGAYAEDGDHEQAGREALSMFREGVLRRPAREDPRGSSVRKQPATGSPNHPSGARPGS